MRLRLQFFLTIFTIHVLSLGLFPLSLEGKIEKEERIIEVKKKKTDEKDERKEKEREKRKKGKEDSEEKKEEEDILELLVRAKRMEETRLSGTKSVKELLTESSSITISPTGMLSYKSWSSDYVTLKVDSLPFIDATSTDASFDFSEISNLDIERIELNEQESPPVINLVTRSNGNQARIYFKGGHGNDGKFFESLEYFSKRGETFQGPSFQYSFGQAHERERGHSQAKGGSEEDELKRDSAFLGASLNLDSRVSIDFKARYRKALIDLDEGPGPMGDLRDYTLDSRHRFLGLIFSLGSRTKFFLSQNFYKKMTHAQKETLNFSSKGISNELSLAQTLVAKEKLKSSFTLSFLEEKAMFDLLEEKKQNKFHLKLDTKYRASFFDLATSLRLGREEQASLHLKHPLKTDVETGLNLSYTKKQATLYERYSHYGKMDLDEESATSASLYFKWKNLKLSLFESIYRHEIIYNFQTNHYDNGSDKNHLQGLDLGFDFDLPKGVQAKSSYTYLVPGKYLRRPSHKMVLNLKKSFTHLGEKIDLDLGAQLVGKRKEIFNQDLPSYFLLDLSLVHEYFFFEWRNVLDKDYEEIKGYTTKASTVFLGMKVQI